MFKSKYSTTEIFEELPIKKSLLTLALPAIAGQLITLMYNLADTFFIGRVNNPLMMTAMSLSFPIFALTAPLAIIEGTGGGALVSRLLGIYKEKDAKKVATFSVYCGLAMGIIYAFLTFIFMDPLLRFLGASDDAFLYTKQYLTCIVVCGGIPTILESVIANLLRCVGHSREAGIGISMGGILNIILDPIFMFVILPEGNEVIGAGIATMLSNLAILIYFLIKVASFSKTTPLGLNPKDALPEAKYIKEVFKVGLPAASTTLLFDANNLILNKLMSAYGDIAVAAIGMTIKIERLSLNTCVGLCLGMMPLVAYNYSNGNSERMLGTIKTARTLGIIVSIVSITLYEIFAPQLTAFFIDDAETVALGAAFLRRRAIASIFMFLSFYIPHVLQGVGDGKMNLLFTTLRYIAFCIPMLFITNYFMGMYGLAFAQFFGDLITTIVTGIIFSKYMKKIVAQMNNEKE